MRVFCLVKVELMMIVWDFDLNPDLGQFVVCCWIEVEVEVGDVSSKRRVYR